MSFERQVRVMDHNTAEDTRIPVTVLTGFLGSGKTTLLNWLLSASHGKRIAVIENEFGEVGIDDSLLKKDKKVSSAENVVVMNNGCICCTVRGDLIETLTNVLWDRRGVDYDHIVIETTGLADPAPVCQTFFVDEKVAKGYRLDAVVTVIDAAHIEMHLDEKKPEGVENESVEQLAFADRVILNKTDLISDPETLQRLKGRIHAINHAAPIVLAQLSKGPIDDMANFVLGVGAFNLDNVLSREPTFLSEDPSSHVHDLSVSSVGVSFVGDLSITRLNRMIGKMLREKGNDLLRYKGVLSVRNEKRKFVFQGVHMLFDGELSEQMWEEKEERRNRFIFIGRNLNRAEIESEFKACMMKEGGSLRYKVGTKVFANTEYGWLPGVIKACWDEGSPYRIRLNKSPKLGNQSIDVWAPDDDDAFVRAPQNQ